MAKWHPALLLLPLAGGVAAGLWMLHPNQSQHTEPTQASAAVAPVPMSKTPSSGTPASSWQTVIQQLSRLAHCEQDQSCPPDSKTDPYAADYARNQHMQTLLGQLTQAALQPTVQPTLRHVAVEYLQWPDGHVQSAALTLLSTLPAEQGNVPVITQALQQSFDAPLMRQALQELARYPDQKKELQPFFSQVMQTGSFYAAQEVAQGLQPFLSPDTLGSYQTLLSQLDPQSAKAQMLAATLKEYELRASGG